MKILLKYSLGKLVPHDAISEKGLENLSQGDVVICEIKKPRNVRFHRKFFSMLSCAHVHMKEGLEYPTFDDFRTDVTVAAGFYSLKTGISGQQIKVAKSISFARMDEIEFEQLYNRCLDVILLHVLPIGTERLEFEGAINEILGFG